MPYLNKSRDMAKLMKHAQIQGINMIILQSYLNHLCSLVYYHTLN